jgi:hypothetical protein
MQSKGSSAVIDKELELWKLDVEFTCKPLIFGGLAMEYYCLRKRGADIDFFVTDDVYQALTRRYPNNRKDMWGDLGVLVDGYEMFRSVYRLDYDFFAMGAEEYDVYRVISLDRLLLMKVLARDSSEKAKQDLDLVLGLYLKNQRPEWEAYKDSRIGKYLAVPDGIIYNSVD